MSKAVQMRRGTTVEHSTFIGLAGEVTYDTVKKTLVAHDGSTTGGFELARVDAIGSVALADITDWPASVSATELSYLDGVSSAIQTQLDGKAASSHGHAISDVTNLQASLDAKASTGKAIAMAIVFG